MRILYVITRSIPAGSQMHVLELIRALADRHEIALLTGEAGFLADEAARLNARIFVVPELVRSVLPHRDFTAVVKAQRIIRQFAPDIIHTHCSKAGLIGRLAGRLEGIPTIYTAHGWRFAPGVAWAERVVAWPGEWVGARLGERIITVSNCDYNLTTRYQIAGPNKVVLIHNGIGDCPVSSRKADRSEMQLVMVARFAPPKDHLLVMRALQGLPAHVRLLFVGDGPSLTETVAQAITLGISHRVSFLGQRTDVNEILSVADVLVLASNSEGLPISILEGLRAGLPVVATDVGGVRDCVHDGGNGMVVPRGDLNSLRSALSSLVETPSLRTRMGAQGRKLYEQRFTAAEMVSKTHRVYEQVMHEADRKAAARSKPAVVKPRSAVIETPSRFGR